MKIQLKEITVKELTEGYEDNQENGIVGYNGKLDIRPPFQREFVYKDTQRDAVINTIRNEFPLNVMYWAVREDNTYEIIDGQQRTISICQYVKGEYSINGLAFHNLQSDKQNQILNYKLMVYFCSGTDSEKLEWFETINIAGEKLMLQELRNAVYMGSWVTDAKKYFSKTACPAYQLASKYVNGSPIRQDYLQTVISWISNNDILNYMSKHQHDNDAIELWQYFQSVINWVQILFIKYRKEMKGIDWGSLYNQYKNEIFNANSIEDEIKNLMLDDDVSNKKGIYYYVLTHSEKYLSIRSFTDAQKREAYERQNGICSKCGKHFELEQMEADHITPWSEGGKTLPDNCQMLCKNCNRVKSNK